MSISALSVKYIYMQILSVEQIWDSFYGRDRMQIRRVSQDDSGNIRTTREIYYYTVYDHRGQLDSQTLKAAQVDVKA